MTEKGSKTKKENIFKRWWRETIGELKKVNWPTPPEAWRLTKIVIGVIVVMGLLLGGLDYVFTQVIGWIVG